MSIFKKVLGLAATGVALAAISGPALADLALSPPADCQDENPTPYNESELINDCAASLYEPDPDPLTLTYKQDEGGGESGAFAGNYQTTFNGDLSGGSIVWTGGSAIDCINYICMLIVKDGAQDPGHYIFDISGWDGVETIVLSGFWPSNGSISHVAIWGGGEREVPEPATLGLLGLGLAGLGFGARRRRKI